MRCVEMSTYSSIISMMKGERQIVNESENHRLHAADGNRNDGAYRNGVIPHSIVNLMLMPWTETIAPPGPLRL
jgi:hypothetical protein